MSDKMNFSVEVIDQYRNDEDTEFSIMRLEFLSDGFNSHGLKISNEVLTKCASTIRGKWVVCKYDKQIGDARGHETDEFIVGRVPDNAEITFEKRENGTFACCDAVISKLYAHEVVQMFKDYNHRSVSIEALFSYVDNDSTKEVESFVIVGVTILGLDINPSCRGANCEIVRFSEADVNKYYNKYNGIQKFAKERREKLNKNNTTVEETEVINKFNTICELGLEDNNEEKEVESEKMKKEKDNDIIMETELQEQEEDKKEEELSETETMADVEEEEKLAEVEEDKEEDSDKEKAEMSDEEETEDKEEDSEELSAIKEELSQKEEIIKAQEAELEALRQYKFSVEEEQKKQIVSTTLAQVKAYTDEALYQKFSDKAEECRFEDITAWRNEVLASVTDNVLQMSEKQDAHISMEIPQAQSEKGLWD